MAVNEQGRDAYGLDVGSTVTFVQDPPSEDFPFPVPPGSAQRIEQRMTIVGVMDGVGSDEPDATVSSVFYETYRSQLVGPVNAMVDLRGGSGDLDLLREDVDRLMGKAVNVEDADDLFGVRQIRNISRIEAGGLLLFAVAVLIGAGALIGQALVRAVSARSDDASTWRAIGADRRLVGRAVVAPAVLTAAVAAVTTVAVAVALSPRFPIGLTRQFDFDLGFHVDWTVLLPGAIGIALVVTLAAWVTVQVMSRRPGGADRAARAARWSPGRSLPPAFDVGTRLATESGRSDRAVPIRSALVGAIAGVVGVVACLTFRDGLTDAVSDPSRSGVVWDHEVAKAGLFGVDEIATVTSDPSVGASLRATWARAVAIDRTATPTFGVEPITGAVALEIIDGAAPSAPDEIALAPKTMDALHLRIGDHTTVGDGGRQVVVVGRALLPATSHTDYDQGAWMTHDGLFASLPDDLDVEDDFFEDYLLLQWARGADVSSAAQRLQPVVDEGEGVYAAQPAELPSAVASLRDLRVLPLELAVFFTLLAIATVAHALVTTVRRRRSDLAILRSLGFTKGDTRMAITWQATLLAAVGALIGVPLGIILGRTLWRQFAETFPVAYTPPLALLAIVIAVPVAILIANALAVGPAHRATRTRPAEVLRSE